jgi:hypothetical protein
MVSLETVGYYSEEPGSQSYPPVFRFFFPDRGNFIGLVSDFSRISRDYHVINIAETVYYSVEGRAISGKRPKADTASTITQPLPGC